MLMFELGGCRCREAKGTRGIRRSCWRLKRRCINVIRSACVLVVESHHYAHCILICARDK